ncbi:hypothetical protein FA10DRAFT_296100 [Acaromyces ingoldii]|uniref:Uncharacterized protein n=1 Tax=Acaromyces ingoldii TaxID=215250 RepID=A0A316YKN7_9BASI|nr:hypothetical protein FA10DRAFT_296100 [Acaromyces ingoldii]PWN88613.1 hypothetical protein FA10DRAFT_296100 [Acaromyces ingoldii]
MRLPFRHRMTVGHLAWFFWLFCLVARRKTDDQPMAFQTSLRIRDTSQSTIVLATTTLATAFPTLSTACTSLATALTSPSTAFNSPATAFTSPATASTTFDLAYTILFSEYSFLKRYAEIPGKMDSAACRFQFGSGRKLYETS